MQLDRYRCDRCGQEYSIEHGQIAEHITQFAHGETTISHLCEACIASFYFWLSAKYHEKFDDLANKLAEEEWSPK